MAKFPKLSLSFFERALVMVPSGSVKSPFCPLTHNILISTISQSPKSHPPFPSSRRHRRPYSPSHHHSSSSRRLKPRFNSSPPRSAVAVSFPLSSSSRRLRPPCLPVPAVAFGASDSGR
ncbi:hypothetical protein PIB30_027892 [Stylosanthes scabra]|uniref:Uncharacterized protein n=1 Tax=Stylosanthes scabra TaxID=79078 RepID=A0ABU6YB19_9FABA|nr:hypothetical protein [Stylosanthes scabra]